MSGIKVNAQGKGMHVTEVIVLKRLKDVAEKRPRFVSGCFQAYRKPLASYQGMPEELGERLRN